MNTITLDELIDKELKDKEFSDFYQKELMINNIAKLIVEARQRAGLTQKELAEKAKTTQPAIARIESGNDQRLISIDLLSRIANAVNARLDLSIKY